MKDLLMYFGTALVTAVTTIWGYYNLQKLKRMELDFEREKRKHSRTERRLEELETNILAVDVLMNYSFLNELKEQVARIFEQSAADRFLLLFAVNGKTELQFATAILEQHKENSFIKYSVGAVSKYVQVPIDDRYREMLKYSERTGLYEFVTAKEPDGILREAYQAERVTHSLIKFIRRISIDDQNDVVVYTSVATHNSDGFSEDEKLLIKNLHTPIRSFAQSLKIEHKKIA